MLTGKALIIFSGGQDSTTCLYWAIKNFGHGNVEAITFDYGQRHKIEIESAIAISKIANVSIEVIPINTFESIGNSALTNNETKVKNDLSLETNLPNTFVPGRNIIFLTFAAAYAYKKKILNLVTGVAQTDYSGYPDCRQETIRATEESIKLGMEFDIKIHTPLMFKSKKQTVEMALELGALEAIGYSHTCYNGERPPCGTCQACNLRNKGFSEAGISDPLLAQFKEDGP